MRLALCRESGCGVCRFGSERSLTGRAELVCIFRFVVCGIWSLAVTGRTIRRLPGVVGVQCGPVPGIGDPLRNRPVQNPHRIGSHMWTFMVDTDGRKLPYLWNYYNIDREERMEEKYGKVYRDYFSVQTTNWAVSYPDEDIPGILKNPFLRDVSDEYFGRNVAVVPLYDSAGDGR